MINVLNPKLIGSIKDRTTFNNPKNKFLSLSDLSCSVNEFINKTEKRKEKKSNIDGISVFNELVNIIKNNKTNELIKFYSKKLKTKGYDENFDYNSDIIDFSKRLYESNYLNWSELSKNPNAISILKKYNNNINYFELCKNNNGLDIIKENFNKINTNVGWQALSTNLNAIELLKNNKENIYWNELSENSNAIELIISKIKEEKYKKKKKKYSSFKDNICYDSLSKNKNINKIIELYPEIISDDKVDFISLSSNSNAINILKNNSNNINLAFLCKNTNLMHFKDLLEENYNKLNWDLLSLNPGAIELIEKKLEEENKLSDNEFEELKFNKVNFYNLSRNENAIHILENNKDRIDYVSLALNTNYKAIDIIINYLETLEKNNKQYNTEYIDIYKNLCSNKNAIFLIEGLILKEYYDFKYLDTDVLNNDFNIFKEFYKKYYLDEYSKYNSIDFYQYFSLVGKEFYDIYFEIVKICSPSINRNKVNNLLIDKQIHKSWIPIFENLLGSEIKYLSYGKALLKSNKKNNYCENINYFKTKINN